jgi:subtilisin family serine protease
MPLAGRSELFALRDRLVVKLRLGEAPEAIPTALDVKAGAAVAAPRTGVDTIDRVLSHFGGETRVVRVHDSAASLGSAGASHRGYDELEHVLGLSRTFQVRSASGPLPVDDAVDALRSLAVVESATPHYLCATPFAAVALDPDLDDDLAWAARDLVGAAEALAYEPGDPSILCAVVDTGIVDTHPELDRPNVRSSGPDTVELGAGDLAVGLELLGDVSVADRSPHDDAGHGTHCAAIVAGAGLLIPPGLASGCSLLPVRVLGSARMPGRQERIGIGRIADIDRGCKLAVDLGAKVLNLSFGTALRALDADDPVPHADVVEYALARGCVLVAASGNSGREERMTPACLDGVIAVGAAGNDGAPARFTSTGSHVTLCAPGERIVTADLEGYARATGTSFAAPFVTAAAALLVSRAARRGVALAASDVEAVLRASARPWPPPAPRGFGAGVLDAAAALRLLDREIDRAVSGNGVNPRKEEASP